MIGRHTRLIAAAAGSVVWLIATTVISCGGGDGATPTAPSSATAATVTSISVSASAATVNVGMTATVTATASYSDGTTAEITPTWASDDILVATVSTSGVVTGVAKGTATITATADGQNGSVDITVQCSYDVTPSTFIFGPAGGTGEFTVETSSSCEWYVEELSSAEDWIFDVDATAQYGSSTKTFRVGAGHVPAGYPAPREGTIRGLDIPGFEIYFDVTVSQTAE